MNKKMMKRNTKLLTLMLVGIGSLTAYGYSSRVEQAWTPNLEARGESGWISDENRSLSIYLPDAWGEMTPPHYEDTTESDAYTLDPEKWAIYAVSDTMSEVWVDTMTTKDAQLLIDEYRSLESKFESTIVANDIEIDGNSADIIELKGDSFKALIAFVEGTDGTVYTINIATNPEAYNQGEFLQIIQSFQLL